MKTQPDSRPKWAKCIPIFRPKQRKNPTRWGGIYLYGLYKGVPPPLPGIYSDYFAVFTPLQFVAAGDHLVHHCPTWKWCVLIL